MKPSVALSSLPGRGSRVVGSCTPGASPPRIGPKALGDALRALGEPVVVVVHEGQPAVVSGAQVELGGAAREGALDVLGWVPPLLPGQLGDASFCDAYGVRAAYVVGEMAAGIASEDLVEAAARAGFLGIFGAAGLPLPRVEAALDRLEKSLGPRSASMPHWGINLIHSPEETGLEDALVSVFLRRGVPFVSAAAFIDLTLPIVRYRVAGIHKGADGRVVVPNRVMAKVSRVEVARRFLAPPPDDMLEALVASGHITAEQAALARTVPMADDVTAEADSGGHTDNRPLVLLLPSLQALRDELVAAHALAIRPRVGAAGGLATPASVAAAFAMGAAYVVTGSINQACRESGTSDVVRQMLAECASTDVGMAPAADMFEIGAQVQVLTRGTLFAVRARRLHEIYRVYSSIDELPADVRAELEQKYLRRTIDEEWEGCRAFFAERDPRQLDKAAKDPKHKLALVLRAYMGRASRWAKDAVPDRRLDYQVWCGPAMGAFNAWARGSSLEPWENRRAVVVAKNLVCGAAFLTRVAALRAQGVDVPADAQQFAPCEEAALDALMAPTRPSPAQRPARAERKAPGASRGREEPVAIIGLGGLYPNASNLQALWALLRTGKDAITDVPASHWSPADYYDADPKAPDKTYAKRGAFLDPHAFDPTEFGIPPSILEATDTSQLLGLVAARMAMEDAGYGEDVAWDRARASVLLGVTGTQELVISLGARLGHPRWRKALLDSGIDAATADEVVERIGQSYVGWQENSFPGLLGNVVAGRIANRLDFGGTNCVVDAACASSLGAVHLGVLELRSGKSDLVLTGGVDSLNDIFMHMCFSKTPALSPTGDVRPFSDRADGTLLGEALGMLVLKRLSDAERDGDRVYATIRGVGTSSDGRAKSIYAPLPSGQARALRTAYREANVRPRDIDLIEAHGTGTKAGDAAEVEALREVYREDSTDQAWCALGSVKSQVGHTKAAAGAVGMTKVALALHHKVVLPTLKVDAPNPALQLAESPFTISTETRPWLRRAEGPRLAALSSFGFGGSNFHIVLEEHGAARSEPAWDGSVEILSLSAPTAEALRAEVDAASKLSRKEIADFAAASRARFRASDEHRLVCVLAEDTSPAALLAPAIDKLAGGPGAPFALGTGVFYGVGAPAGKLAFLFPGQGAQHVNMLRELACVFPEMLAAVESDLEIARAIYPAPTFDESERTRREQHLTKTNNAQPAIGAVSRGLLDVLARFGVRAELAAGHSYGELSALHAAGVLDAPSLGRLSALRGKLMAGDGEDRGSMMAVLAPLAEIERAIEEEGLGVVLANRNSPTQGVLSGSRADLARAEEVCKARGLRTTRLSVGAAFHSPLVADAAEAFRKELDSVAFGAPSISVIAGSNAEPYPHEAVDARGLLGHQLALPVRFDEVVERLYADGARTFIEVGPRAALTGMVRAIIGSREHVAVAIDAQRSQGGLFDLAHALARVAGLGHAVDLTSWQQVSLPPRTTAKAPREAKMAVPLTGANHRNPTAPMPPRPPAPKAPAAGATWALAPTASAPAASSAVLEMLRANQEALRALQSQQEQTARIHQLFLEGQQQAQQSFHALLTGQGQLSHAVLGGAAPPFVAAPGVGSHAPVASAPAAAVAPQAAAAAAAPVAQGQSAASGEAAGGPSVDIVATLLDVVVETTGYPREILNLKMQMESELGIDSIKRVEILSLLSKRVPGAPSVNPEKLGSLRTLQHVVDFLGGAMREAAPADGAPTAAARLSATNGSAEHATKSGNGSAEHATKSGNGGGEHVAKATNGASHAAPRPAPSLTRSVVVPVRLERPAQASLTFPTDEIVVTRDAAGLADALVAEWKRRGARARVVTNASAISGPVGGLVLLAPGDGPWKAEHEAALKGALGLARAFGPRLVEAAGRGAAMLACVSRRDGAFGHASTSTAGHALAGGLAGLVKTAAHEWPRVACTAIDVAASLRVADAAREIVDELGAPPSEGWREVGIGPAGRTTLALREQPAVVDRGRLARGDLVVVTGGARGVTADCARALAEATGASLLLLGRSALADEPAHVARALDEASVKRALLEHASPSKKPTPKKLGEACRAIMAGREIRANLDALAKLGVRAAYRAVDVRDPRALGPVLVEARKTMGPVRGIIHGAGVLRDKRIEDKRDEDFDEVVDTKLAGLRVLFDAVAEDDLRFVALFASVSGRFGRRGQADYALANQALVSIAQVEAARRPGARVVALDWGPWDGGMVTPALRAEFQREGVGLIALDAGARALVAEALTAPGGPVEVVISAGRFGGDARQDETDASASWTLASTHLLDPATHPVLADHRLAGKAVLPFAMSLEWLAQAARRVVGGEGALVLEDARVLKGMTLGAHPEHVGIWVGPVEDGRAPVEVLTANGEVLVRAFARPCAPLVAPEPLGDAPGLGPYPHSIDAVYDELLFHGPSLRAIEAVDGIGSEGMSLRVRAHATSEELLPPPVVSWVTDPLAVDAVLQALILWCRELRGAPSLPSHVARMTQYRAFAGAELVRAVVRVREVAGASVTSDVDLVDGRGVVLRLEGYSCTVSATLDRAFRSEASEAELASTNTGT